MNELPKKRIKCSLWNWNSCFPIFSFSFESCQTLSLQEIYQIIQIFFFLFWQITCLWLNMFSPEVAELHQMSFTLTTNETSCFKLNNMNELKNNNRQIPWFINYYTDWWFYWSCRFLLSRPNMTAPTQAFPVGIFRWGQPGFSTV